MNANLLRIAKGRTLVIFPTASRCWCRPTRFSCSNTVECTTAAATMSCSNAGIFLEGCGTSRTDIFNHDHSMNLSPPHCSDGVNRPLLR